MGRLKVIFTRGISGSGKSTWAKQMREDGTYVRANMDLIRDTLALPFSPEAEKLALRIQDRIVLDALRAGKNVVVDNLHLHKTWPRRIAQLVWENGFTVDYEIRDFDEPLIICQMRNADRSDNHGVTDSIIQGQWNKAQKAAAAWTIESITHDLPVIEPVEINPHTTYDNPPAVILDIDGTLAEHVARGPYDMDRLHTDRPFPHIAHLVDMYQNAYWTVILCSGREEKWRQKTCQWLDDHCIQTDHLFMRPTGDERRDSIIKLELHNKYIRGQHAVQLVFDDRDRVVNVWRALGYPCLQVAPGDF